MFKQEVFRQVCTKSLGAMAITAALQFSLVSGANAGTIVQCGVGQTACTADFSIDITDDNGRGTTVGGGVFQYDPRSGAISLPTDPITGRLDTTAFIGGVISGDVGSESIAWRTGNSTVFQLDSIFGNADPVLGTSFSVSTGVSGSSVGMTLSLPIAISGPIQARSDWGFSLTGTTAAGAELSTTGGNTNIVRAWDIDDAVNGLDDINKGVDVGTGFFFTGVDQQASEFDAINFFNLGAGFDRMVVEIDFRLSAFSELGVSGFVEQLVVPLPAALPLFLSGLAGFGLLTRRRRKLALA